MTRVLGPRGGVASIVSSARAVGRAAARRLSRAWLGAATLTLLCAAAATPQGRPALLAVKPAAGPPGTVLTVTGSGLGASISTRRLVLTAVAPGRPGAAVRLEVLRWTATQVRARIPRDAALQGAALHVALLDPRGRELARSPDAFALETSTGEGAQRAATVAPAPQSGATAAPRPAGEPGRAPQVVAKAPTLSIRTGTTTARASQLAPGTGSRAALGGPWASGVLAGARLGPNQLADVLPGLPTRGRTYRATGLVLAGGGSKGAFQVGVLKYLYEHQPDFKPAIITGTSVGSLNAAKLAEGDTHVIPGMLELWRGIRGNEDIYVDSPAFTEFVSKIDEDIEDFQDALTAGHVLGVLFPGVGTFISAGLAEGNRPELGPWMRRLDRVESLGSQSPLIRTLRASLDPEKIANSGIKLRVATVARDKGQLCYVTEGGDVVDAHDAPIVHGRYSIFPSGVVAAGSGQQTRILAMRRRDEHGEPPPPEDPPPQPDPRPTIVDGVIASSAIPLVFEPCWISGQLYWDGAIREDVPIRKALELGATDLIVVLTSPRRYAPASLATLPEDFNVTPVKRLMQSMDIMADQVFQDDINGVLDQLDLLHELGQGIAPRVRSFPLPRDLFTVKPFMIPYYTVIEPPFTLGEVTAFEPEIISANIELGELVARHALLNPPAPQQERADIVAFMNRQIAYWDSQRRQRNDAQQWRDRFSSKLREYNNSSAEPRRERVDPRR
ncbi:MAG: patatin-like phospholipase family protein [Candidatus Eisenbacteria bacterium]|nr:patatin-like phospholipase family protein [Candidatus Eisenbacteria bacterium]